MNGRYPYKSAWAFKQQRTSNMLSFLREQTKSPVNYPTPWQDWFLTSDGIGFGIIKRWNGTEWVVCNNIKVHAF